jgi:hypothetical protein
LGRQHIALGWLQRETACGANGLIGDPGSSAFYGENMLILVPTFPISAFFCQVNWFPEFWTARHEKAAD